MKVAVSGANGYVGRHIVNALLERGHEVVRLLRSGGKQASGEWLEFDVHGVCPTGDEFREFAIDSLIHCAWDFSSVRSGVANNPNVIMADRLASAAKRGEVKTLIYISTMSAFAGCRSRYGIAKLASERAFLEHNGAIIRPGLVWSDDAGGMVGTIDWLVRNFMIVPLIGNGRQSLYLIHADDLADIVCTVAEGALASSSIIVAAAGNPMSLRDLLGSRAKTLDRSPVLIPVPWKFVWFGLRAMEVILPWMNLRSDSVVSFVYADLEPKLDIEGIASYLSRELRPFPKSK